MACQKSLSILHLMNFLCIIFYNVHTQRKGKKSAPTDLKCFWPFNCKKLPSMKPKLNSVIGVD